MIKPLQDLDSVYSMLIHNEQHSELQSFLPSFVSKSVSFSITGPSSRKPYPSNVDFENRLRMNFDNRNSNMGFDNKNFDNKDSISSRIRVKVLRDYFANIGRNLVTLY